MIAKELLKRLEEHKGREIDLNNHRDRTRFFSMLEREFDKRDAVVYNIRNVLSGQSTYDQTQYKVILDSNRRK